MRFSSLETVEADTSMTAAIRRNDWPWARKTAISSRCAKDKHRPFKSLPRRGRTPPASANTRRPVRLLVPSGMTASVMKSPACIPAQNTCSRSGLKKIE
ncbi:hypothetical protein IWX64_003405 [Arthrobacter sp. CAN_A212]